MNLEDLYRLLRSNHVQAQGIIDTLDDPLLVLDQSGSVLNGNRAFFGKFALHRDDTLGRSLFELGGHQWDNPELRKLLSDIIPKSAAVIGYEVTADFPPFGQRTMLVNARRLAHPDNNSSSILMVFEDVTEQRRDDAAKDILLAETRHRMKNLLAVVQVLATQTEVEGRSAEEFRDAFLGRLHAMVRAEDISTAGDGQPNIGVLVEQALERAGPGRSRVEPGPAVPLTREQVVPLSLILHELTTNSFKYGALSAPDGVVHLTWQVSPEAGREVLKLDWKEENGPPVTTPRKTGFGTRLIQFSAAKTLGGSAELSFAPKGLEVRVAAPLRQG
jgi:PAS domain S-box-containing protein